MVHVVPPQEGHVIVKAHTTLLLAATLAVIVELLRALHYHRMLKVIVRQTLFHYFHQLEQRPMLCIVAVIHSVVLSQTLENFIKVQQIKF